MNLIILFLVENCRKSDVNHTRQNPAALHSSIQNVFPEISKGIQACSPRKQQARAAHFFSDSLIYHSPFVTHFEFNLGCYFQLTSTLLLHYLALSRHTCSFSSCQCEKTIPWRWTRQFVGRAGLWKCPSRLMGGCRCVVSNAFKSAPCPSLPKMLHFTTILFQQDLCCVLNVSNTLECQKAPFVRLNHWPGCPGQGSYTNPFGHRPLFILYKLPKAGVISACLLWMSISSVEKNLIQNISLLLQN